MEVIYSTGNGLIQYIYNIYKVKLANFNTEI